MNDKIAVLTEGLTTIESLARRLFERHWNSLQEIWEIELDLLKFIMKIQKDMRTERRNYKDLKNKLSRRQEAIKRQSREDNDNLR